MNDYEHTFDLENIEILKWGNSRMIGNFRRGGIQVALQLTEI